MSVVPESFSISPGRATPIHTPSHPILVRPRGLITYKDPVVEEPEDPAPKPSRWKGQSACQQTLESIYHVPFRSIHPDWLRGERDRNLELDCYAVVECRGRTIEVACEYNGAQHYVYPNVWHKTREEYDIQQWNDGFKRRQCEERGVYLVIIPYTIPIHRIPETIRQCLDELGILP